MPTILAIDTSTDACSVALMIDENTVVESSVIAPREHTQRILPMVAGLLKQQDVKLKDIDALGFGCGPGSFTGLRICISVAQGLGYGADIPLIPISNLYAMAQGVLRLSLEQGLGIQTDESDAVIIPIFDARMNEVYWSAYRVVKESNSLYLTAVLPESVCSPVDCHNAILGIASSCIYPAGSGWEYEPLIHQELSQNKLSLTSRPIYSSAVDIAQLAWKDYLADKTINPIAVEPTYLRNEISWKKRARVRKKIV
ncbi:MAG: tRNA threonylcarbamoyladenosine biosynthesis protein TsaB [Cellvibrionaceae bacterium]|jgi:tRNA threonylcarbamoyladenosine biosynthesis protein TsaB